MAAAAAAAVGRYSIMSRRSRLLLRQRRRQRQRPGARVLFEGDADTRMPLSRCREKWSVGQKNKIYLFQKEKSLLSVQLNFIAVNYSFTFFFPFILARQFTTAGMTKKYGENLFKRLLTKFKTLHLPFVILRVQNRSDLENRNTV